MIRICLYARYFYMKVYLYSFWFGLRNSYLVILNGPFEDMSQLSYLCFFLSLLSYLFDGELESEEGLLPELIHLSTDPEVAKEFWCGCIIFKYAGTGNSEV